MTTNPTNPTSLAVGRTLVVGFDGSPAGYAALSWALDEATGPNDEVVALLAYGAGALMTPGVPAVPSWSDEVLDELLDKAVAYAADRSPGVRVRTSTSLASSGAALVHASTTAELVILGGTKHNPIGEVFLGATGPQVVAHAHCPTVVVPVGDVDARAPIVVGVDGSTIGEGALEFAFARADATGADILAVHAWWFEAPSRLGDPVLSLEGIGALEAAHEALAEDALDPWRAKYPSVGVELQTVRSHPVLALRQAAERASLLVVGSRGHGGFAGLILGSISQGLLHNLPTSPLVVVPVGHR